MGLGRQPDPSLGRSHIEVELVVEQGLSRVEEWAASQSRTVGATRVPVACTGRVAQTVAVHKLCLKAHRGVRSMSLTGHS